MCSDSTRLVVRLCIKIELENRVLLEKMSKIMRQDPTEARSSQGARNSEQFPFRSTLQVRRACTQLTLPTCPPPQMGILTKKRCGGAFPKK